MWKVPVLFAVIALLGLAFVAGSAVAGGSTSEEASLEAQPQVDLEAADNVTPALSGEVAAEAAGLPETPQFGDCPGQRCTGPAQCSPGCICKNGCCIPAP